MSTVVAFGRPKVGVLWSNQLEGAVYWAVHVAGTARDKWSIRDASRAPKTADDHLNIKSVRADDAVRRGQDEPGRGCRRPSDGSAAPRTT